MNKLTKILLFSCLFQVNISPTISAMENTKIAAQLIRFSSEEKEEFLNQVFAGMQQHCDNQKGKDISQGGWAHAETYETYWNSLSDNEKKYRNKLNISSSFDAAKSMIRQLVENPERADQFFTANSENYLGDNLYTASERNGYIFMYLVAQLMGLHEGTLYLCEDKFAKYTNNFKIGNSSREVTIYVPQDQQDEWNERIKDAFLYLNGFGVRNAYLNEFEIQNQKVKQEINKQIEKKEKTIMQTKHKVDRTVDKFIREGKLKFGEGNIPEMKVSQLQINKKGQQFEENAADVILDHQAHYDLIGFITKEGDPTGPCYACYYNIDSDQTFAETFAVDIDSTDIKNYKNKLLKLLVAITANTQPDKTDNRKSHQFNADFSFKYYNSKIDALKDYQEKFLDTKNTKFTEKPYRFPTIESDTQETIKVYDYIKEETVEVKEGSALYEMFMAAYRANGHNSNDLYYNRYFYIRPYIFKKNKDTNYYTLINYQDELNKKNQDTDPKIEQTEVKDDISSEEFKTTELPEYPPESDDHNEKTYTENFATQEKSGNKNES